MLLLVRAIINSLAVAVLTIVGGITAMVASVFDRRGNVVVDMARAWSCAVTGLAGVKIAVDIRGQLDHAQPYVFMSNHLSAVDIWALFIAIPARIRMIAKKQLGSVPFLGWAMRAGRFIFIDRQNAHAARRTIDEATRRIRGGESVLLFPEGTRSRDGTLQPFKKGGFHLAMEAGVPIVPVAILGTRETMPPGSLLLRPGRVRVIVGAPIPTGGLAESDRPALIERVRGEIAAMLEK